MWTSLMTGTMIRELRPLLSRRRRSSSEPRAPTPRKHSSAPQTDVIDVVA
jgi:hypothetical protein